MLIPIYKKCSNQPPKRHYNYQFRCLLLIFRCRHQ